MSVHIAIIVAMAENRVIGRDNEMPWRLPSDLKRFRVLTMGKPIVMGRKTFQSIGRPLDGRDNIVVTRDAGFSAEGVHITGSLDEALALARELAERRGAEEAMVIGGAEIYAQALASADRLYVTEVAARPEGDALFPEIDPELWLETGRDGPVQGPKDSAPVSYVTYERTNN